MRVNRESTIGAGITAGLGLLAGGLVASPSPADQVMFVVVSGVLAFAVLQIIFRLPSVQASDRKVRRLLTTVTIFAILTFVIAAFLLKYIIVLTSP